MYRKNSAQRQDDRKMEIWGDYSAFRESANIANRMRKINDK